MVQIFEQAKRDTTKAAYVAIFEIGHEMTKIDDPSFEMDRQVLEAQIGNLRGTLVEKPDDIEEIKRQTEALQGVSPIFTTLHSRLVVSSRAPFICSGLTSGYLAIVKHGIDQ